MHIEEGILSPPVLIAGTVCAAAGVAMGLKKMDAQDIPRVGVLTATFFVASLIHVPFGVASAHLILNGLLGILLGWVAFPAIFIGLTLQTLFFGYGGLSVLGVNTLTMALPAVLCHYLFRPTLETQSGARSLPLLLSMGGLGVLGVLLFRSGGQYLLFLTFALIVIGAPFVLELFKKQRSMSAGVLTGVFTGIYAVAGSGILFSTVLLLSGREFQLAAGGILVVHLPLMLVEGIATATILSFLLRVRPEVFNLATLPEANNA